MGRRKDFKQEMGTFVSPHGPVSYRTYKGGQVKWDLGSVGGRASLRKPEDDVQVVILAAMVESDLAGAAQPQPAPLKPIAAAAEPPPPLLPSMPAPKHQMRVADSDLTPTTCSGFRCQS